MIHVYTSVRISANYCDNLTGDLDSRDFITVILNGQIRCGGGGAGAWCGVVRARWRRRGHKGHASLKFEKDGSLAKCASGAPKSIADKKVRKSAQGGA